VGERAVEHVAVGVPALAEGGLGDDGVGREEATEVRVVNAALHVDEAEIGVVLVPGEAERGRRRERRRGRRSPGWVAARAEGVVAPLLDDGAGLVRECLNGAEVIHVHEQRALGRRSLLAPPPAPPPSPH